MAKLGYDTLPTWAHWQLERYFLLDDEQRALVGRHIDELHRWHRQAQLPTYVGFLKEVDREITGPTRGGHHPVRHSAAGEGPAVDAATVGRWRDRVVEAWTPMAERLAPGLAELAVTLRPEQIERLRKRLEDSNAEYREKYLPAKARERQEARADRVIKRAEFFLGRLDKTQERELRALAAELPANEDDWLAERLHRQQALVALLKKLSREKPAHREATRQAKEYLLTMWTSQDARRRARLDDAIAASDALSAQMLARATPSQRAHLQQLLRGYADDFHTLSATALAAAR